MNNHLIYIHHAINSLIQRVYVCWTLRNWIILLNIIIFAIPYVAYMTTSINAILLQWLAQYLTWILLNFWSRCKSMQTIHINHHLPSIAKSTSSATWCRSYIQWAMIIKLVVLWNRAVWNFVLRRRVRNTLLASNLIKSIMVARRYIICLMRYTAIMYLRISFVTNK